MIALKSADTAIPISIILPYVKCPFIIDNLYIKIAVMIPKAIATNETIPPLIFKNKIKNTAAVLVPADIPITSGDAKGLCKRFWKT